MSHGSKCSCVMCTIGKRVGVIKAKDEEQNTCSSCGQAAKEDGSCGCN